MKQLKSLNKLTIAKMMVNSNGINFEHSKVSLCKCQNCNNIKLPENVLTKEEIRQMFKKSLN